MGGGNTWASHTFRQTNQLPFLPATLPPPPVSPPSHEVADGLIGAVHVGHRSDELLTLLLELACTRGSGSSMTPLHSSGRARRRRGRTELLERLGVDAAVPLERVVDRREARDDLALPRVLPLLELGGRERADLAQLRLALVAAPQGEAALL